VLRQYRSPSTLVYHLDYRAIRCDPLCGCIILGKDIFFLEAADVVHPRGFLRTDSEHSVPGEWHGLVSPTQRRGSPFDIVGDRDSRSAESFFKHPGG
jgi:hypothetical protein